MTIYGHIRELEIRLREFVEGRLSTIVKLAAYSVSSSSGETDKLQGYQTEGADEQKYDYDGRRIWPFGIRSRPPKGVFGVWIGARSRSGNGVIVAGDSSRFGPSNLNDGETAIYNKVTGCTILLDQNGGITATDKNGTALKLDGAGNASVKVGGATWVAISSSAMTLGSNPAATPVLTVGAVDSMGVPVTNSPTNTGTVKAG